MPQVGPALLGLAQLLNKPLPEGIELLQCLEFDVAKPKPRTRGFTEVGGVSGGDKG